MATMFIQQSEEYVLQIEAEIERLQQLCYQVQTTIQGEGALDVAEVKVPRKRAAKKIAGKKIAATQAPVKRGHSRSRSTVKA